MIERAVTAFPNFKVVATTLRNAKHRHRQRLGRRAAGTTGKFYQAADAARAWRSSTASGGGDSFASGLIYGFLAGKDPQWAVECGAAHGALAMTTPGDTTMATLAEVERVMKGGTRAGAAMKHERADVLATIREVGIVPVVRARVRRRGRSQAIDAIRAGGVPVLEITMTVPGRGRRHRAAVAALRRRRAGGRGHRARPRDGAGLHPGRRAVRGQPGPEPRHHRAAAGATACPSCPGALTPTEVVAAWKAGADMVKVFPCSALGGASYIKALKAPLPQIEIIPTGGVS